jgi:hypothetical protein
MADNIDPRFHDQSAEEFDPGFTREEAEDWLNDIPLFNDETSPSDP